MFNERLFRSKVVLKGITLSQLAVLMGINEVTLHNKIKRGTFYREEIWTIKYVLDLNDDDVIAIFFAQ